MSKFIFPIIALLFTLISCDQPTQISGGSSEFSYGVNIPQNVYDFCGNQNRSDGFVGFDLYCFNDFRAMGLCTYGEQNRDKGYSDCNYDAHISIKFNQDQSNNSADKLLEDLLLEKYPSANITYETVERNVRDALIAEISQETQKSSPTFISVIRTGKDTVITIEGKPSDPSEISKFRKAFEIVASSIFGRITPQVGTTEPES